MADPAGQLPPALQNAVELDMRRQLASEIQQHREFLQRQFTLIVRGISVIVVVALGVLVFLYGKSFSDTKKELSQEITREVDAKVLDYRIIESLQKRLDERVKFSLDSEAARQIIDKNVQKSASNLNQETILKRIDETFNTRLEEEITKAVEGTKITQLIQERVQSTADTYITRRVEGIVSNRIREEIGKLEVEELKVLIRNVVPPNAVIAFALDNECPEGWSPYSPAGGRMIIGAGSHKNKDREGRSLTIYKAGKTDGEEEVTLVERQMPQHRHWVFQLGEGVSLATSDFIWAHDKRGKGTPGATNIKTGSEFAQAEQRPRGADQPHNNMPPFIALYYCKKN